jgi:hypothetical protein
LTRRRGRFGTDNPGTTNRGDVLSGPFIFIATNRLKAGKLEAERRRVFGLGDFIEANEPRLIAFNESSAFGFALMNGGAVPPHIHGGEGTRQLLSCVRDAVRDRGKATINSGVALLMAAQHLENLSRLETLLSELANAIRSAPENGGVLRKLRVLAS